MADPTLRIETPFPPHAWPRVWDWIQPFKGSVFDDTCATTQDEFVEQQLARSQNPGFRSWAFYKDNELGGLAIFETRLPDDPMGFAHTVFKKSFFGRNTTEQALTQLAEEVFAGGVTLIRCEVFQRNSNIRSLCKAIGFVEYGPFRKCIRQGGELIDVVGLSLTPEQLEAANAWSLNRNSDPTLVDHRGRSVRSRLDAREAEQADHGDQPVGPATPTRPETNLGRPVVDTRKEPGNPLPKPNNRPAAKSGADHDQPSDGPSKKPA